MSNRISPGATRVLCAFMAMIGAVFGGCGVRMFEQWFGGGRQIENPKVIPEGQESGDLRKTDDEVTKLIKRLEEAENEQRQLTVKVTQATEIIKSLNSEQLIQRYQYGQGWDGFGHQHKMQHHLNVFMNKWNALVPLMEVFTQVKNPGGPFQPRHSP